MSDSEPKLERVRAIDVKPYRWAVWCTVGDGPQPFANEICNRRWSEDGKTIWFMLESHNFLEADPEEMLELVPFVSTYASAELLASIDRRDAETMAKRPAPKVPCVTCGENR